MGEQILPAAPRFGVLPVNLGTPDSPEMADVRPYLAELLGDRRVLWTDYLDRLRGAGQSRSPAAPDPPEHA